MSEYNGSHHTDTFESEVLRRMRDGGANDEEREIIARVMFRELGAEPAPIYGRPSLDTARRAATREYAPEAYEAIIAKLGGEVEQERGLTARLGERVAELERRLTAIRAEAMALRTLPPDCVASALATIVSLCDGAPANESLGAAAQVIPTIAELRRKLARAERGLRNADECLATAAASVTPAKHSGAVRAAADEVRGALAHLAAIAEPQGEAEPLRVNECPECPKVRARLTRARNALGRMKVDGGELARLAGGASAEGDRGVTGGSHEES